MERGCVLAWMLMSMGCAYDAKGQGTGSSGDDTTAATATATTTAAAATTTSEGEGSSTTAGLDGSSGGGTTSTGESESSSTGEPPMLRRSCAQILMLDPSAATGTHTIGRVSDGAPVEVHCNMDLDGGGWTLVARTEPGEEVPFGWGVAQGVLGDERAPYSLDAIAVGLPFREILVTRSEGFATPVDNAYVIEVPMGFLEDFGAASLEHGSGRTVLGGCTPDPLPGMLSWVGYTDAEDKFFFRDGSGEDGYGVLSNRIRTLYDDCDQGGQLDDAQGALFVR